MNKVKMILRTDEMSKSAKWLAFDKSSAVFSYNEEPSIYTTTWEPYNRSSFARELSIVPYCKNWKKSLRKIVDKLPPINQSKTELLITLANAYLVIERLKEDLLRNIVDFTDTLEIEIEIDQLQRDLYLANEMHDLKDRHLTIAENVLKEKDIIIQHLHDQLSSHT